MREKERIAKIIYDEFVYNMVKQKGLLKIFYYRIFKKKQISNLVKEITLDWIK